MSPRFARRTRRSRPASPCSCLGLSTRVNSPLPQQGCKTRSIALRPRLGWSLPCGVTQLGGVMRHRRNGWTGDTHPRNRSGSEISEPGTRSRTGASPGRRRARAPRSWPDRGGRTGRRTAPRALRAKHSSEPAGRTRGGSVARRAGGAPAAPFPRSPGLLSVVDHLARCCISTRGSSRAGEDSCPIGGAGPRGDRDQCVDPRRSGGAVHRAVGGVRGFRWPPPVSRRALGGGDNLYYQ